MAGEVVVDALPYIDQGYDEPGVREAAFAMVEEECRRYRPTKNYLEHLPPLNITAFETPMMHAEFERLQNRLPHRYTAKGGSVKRANPSQSSRVANAGASKPGTITLSRDRVQAIKDAGAWDDVERRNKMIRAYAAYDRINKG